MFNSTWFRAKTLGISRLTTDSNGEEGTAMEALGKRDDLVFVRAKFVQCPTPRQLQCSLVRFSARVGEIHFIGEGGVDQFLCQTNSWLVGIHVTQMPQFVALLG